jgi:tyrosine-protein phosphatase non-receptor type 23
MLHPHESFADFAFYQTKAKYFASVAQYYRALVDQAAASHGYCLVRLTLSETMAKEAQKVCLAFINANVAPGKDGPSSSTLPLDAASTLKAIIDTHLAIVSHRKAMAVKDNDLIYHDILPTESTLPTIEPLATAKPISIQEIYSSPELQKLIGANTAGAPSNDLFSTLVPLVVHEAASMYSEEKAKLVRGESERVALTDGQLQASLEHMTLPQGVKRFKRDGLQDLSDPGAEVRGWAEEEIEGGGSKGQDGLGSGSDAIDEGLQSVNAARHRARADLDEAQKILDEEAAQCEKLRVRHGDKWSQSPSGLESKSLRSDIKRNREALESAAENDVAIQRLWVESEPLIRILLGGKESLERAFAEALVSTQGSNGQALVNLLDDDDGGEETQSELLQAKVSTIESQLSMLQRIKKERTDCLAELRNRVQSDDISHLLILNRRASADSQTQLFQQELDKFRGTTQRIARNISDQEKVLADLADTWREVNESTRGRSIAQEWEKKNRAREQLVSQLRRAKDSNAQVRAGLGKALAFYSELREISTSLRQGARSFVEERGIERERLLSEMEWEAKGRGNGSSGGNSLDGAFARMNVSRHEAPPAVSYREPPMSQPPPPQARNPPLTSYMNTAPYADLDSAFGGGNSSPRGAPPPPSQHYSSHQQYASPPPPRSYAPQSPASPYQAPPSNYYSQQQPPQQQRAPSLPPPPPQWNSSYSSLPPPPQPPSQSYPYSNAGAPYPGSQRSAGPPPPPLPNQQRQPSYSDYPQYAQQPPPPPPNQWQQQHQYR